MGVEYTTTTPADAVVATIGAGFRHLDGTVLFSAPMERAFNAVIGACRW